LLQKENDQLKEIQQLLAENALLKEEACLVLLLARWFIGCVYFVAMNCPLLWVADFLINILEATRWFKLIAPSALPRLTLAATDLQ
jgi:hypothetical protein